MLCGTMWHFLYSLIFSTATPLGAPLMVGILPQNFVTPFPHQYFFNVEKPCKCLLGFGGCEVIEDDFAETCAKKLPLMAMA